MKYINKNIREYGKLIAVIIEDGSTPVQASDRIAHEMTNLLEGSVRKIEAGAKIANFTGFSLSKIASEVKYSS